MHADESRWILLRTFYQSYRGFHVLFEQYERRVLAFAERYRTDRRRLKLSPQELVSLIDNQALLALRDGELALLREISHQLFRSHDQIDPFDTHVTNAYHEVSILKEEHYTMGDVSMHTDRREYDRYYREVNVYYPRRLKHVRNIYGKARTRLEQLLPTMSKNRIIVRSVYLFGERLVTGVYRDGLERLYQFMYPDGGALTGYTLAADSFRDGGFAEEAAAAYAKGIAVLDRRIAHIRDPESTKRGDADLLERKRAALEHRRESLATAS